MEIDHGNSDVEGHAESTDETSKLTHDSMVTVRLSDTPAQLIGNNPEEIIEEEGETKETTDTDGTEAQTSHMTNQRSSGASQALSVRTSDLLTAAAAEEMSPISPEMVDIQLPKRTTRTTDERRGSDSSGSDGEQVNWEELEKTEEQQPRDQDSEDSTALLLARLEKENNLLVTNPKSGLTAVQAPSEHSRRSQSRPPSMQQLKKMVDGPTPSALRYSLLPAPPMTDLEFYAALVQDYKRTAQRLPTLLSKKIRAGIPPPLRGVVWQSMSGARDRSLEEEFDRLCGESSPYEGIIGKDLGRSFPGVEMFRDPEGDGQMMLGRVLKCFSLYDRKIGYCQGLGFLVGPLLMHMGDKQAFCVLVRLMEHYDLRNCFLPDLSGLHVRIYQFRELLMKHMPKLHGHLAELQIEPAYVSQWFLSFFAVTCPLPMLFRIYDVIFAEGASETIMRVALAVMRKNEDKILACTEFEDVMQLLLSRGLWDAYNYNADDFVEDFVSLTSIVTNDGLKALETAYETSTGVETSTSPASETIGSAASRFLGRLWAGSNASASASAKATTTLSPPAGQARVASFLRRTTSKQSLASTLNSVEGGTDSVVSSSPTEATTQSRDSSNTEVSSRSRTESNTFSMSKTTAANQDHGLHGQIEDLLTALSELQRDHAVLATQLQREREEREEDHQAVRSLLDGLQQSPTFRNVSTSNSESSLDTIVRIDQEDCETSTAPNEDPFTSSLATTESNHECLSRLVDHVSARVIKKKRHTRHSSLMQSKAQLRQELARSKEQLIAEVSKSQDLSRRMSDLEQDLANARDELRESHTHARNAHGEKQRLEKQLLEMKQKKTPVSTPDGAVEMNEWPKRNSSASVGGLRELKLGRAGSVRNSMKDKEPTFTKRSSSLNAANILNKENIPTLVEDSDGSSQASGAGTPLSTGVDADALILELVQAKTAEAVAKQEAEEAKAKLASLRQLLAGDNAASASSGHRPSPSQPSMTSSTSMASVSGLGGYLGLGRLPSPAKTPEMEAPPAATPAASAGGGFWGGWGKRTVSNVTVIAEK